MSNVLGDSDDSQHPGIRSHESLPGICALLIQSLNSLEWFGQVIYRLCVHGLDLGSNLSLVGASEVDVDSEGWSFVALWMYSSELISQREIKTVRRAGRGLRARHSARNSSSFELPVGPLQRNRDIVVQLSKIAGPREGIS